MSIARGSLGLLFCILSSGLLGVAAHAQTGTAAPPPAATAPPPPTPVAFEAALLKAANDLFAKAKLDGAPDKVTLVIDPLIDGVTGAQSNATHLEEKRVVDLVKSSYPRFQVARFSSESVAKSPVVLIGTFTAINNAGTPGGDRDAYRICLALADLKSKTIISKGVARALPEGIDPTPVAFSPIARYSPRTLRPTPTSRAARAPRSATTSIRPMPIASWWPRWSTTASRLTTTDATATRSTSIRRR
jgi:hypothetical protein